MKYILLSDLHLRSSAPEGRQDDYLSAQWEKLSYIMMKAVEDKSIKGIIQAGDFFNAPDPPYWLMNRLIKLFKKYPVPIYAILGQHDMYMRSTDVSRTAFGVLINNGFVKLLNQEGIGLPELHVYGLSWNEKFPQGWKPHSAEPRQNLLVVHDMIGDTVLFPGQKGFNHALDYLAKHPDFGVILTGDYHYPYRVLEGDRAIINTGSMMRMTRLERDMIRVPRYTIFDTETGSLQDKFFPFLNHYKVAFSLWEQSLKKEKVNQNVLAFVDKLKEAESTGLSFVKNLENYLADNDVDPKVQQLIWSVISTQ